MILAEIEAALAAHLAAAPWPAAAPAIHAGAATGDEVYPRAIAHAAAIRRTDPVLPLYAATVTATLQSRFYSTNAEQQAGNHGAAAAAHAALVAAAFDLLREDAQTIAALAGLSAIVNAAKFESLQSSVDEKRGLFVAEIELNLSLFLNN